MHVLHHSINNKILFLKILNLTQRVISVLYTNSPVNTGCPRTGSPEKKGSLRANILTCILKKKSPISNDNREKTF
jgi:hypothetical protein